MTKQEKEEIANMFGWQFAQRLEDEERARKSRKLAKIISMIGLLKYFAVFSFGRKKFGKFSNGIEYIAILSSRLFYCVEYEITAFKRFLFFGRLGMKFKICLLAASDAYCRCG